MACPYRLPISLVVEGDTDEAVLRRIANQLSVEVFQVLGKQGKARILRTLPGINNSARSQPWFVLVDLNGDARCPGQFVRNHLSAPSQYMRFRVAVRQVESWLLADHVGFSKFMGVRPAAMPPDPEEIQDSKRCVVDLAQRSRKSVVRDGMPPRPGSGRNTGGLYASLLIEFAREHWNLEAARLRSRSLDKAMGSLEELAASCCGRN